MRASFYERTGPAGEVLTLGELPDPEPGPGEVRVRVAWSGVNPSDVKSRAGLRTKALPFPRVVPHSDGSGRVDRVGEGVDPASLPPTGRPSPRRPRFDTRPTRLTTCGRTLPAETGANRMQIICPNCGSKSPIEAGSLVTQTRIVCARCAVEFSA